MGCKATYNLLNKLDIPYESIDVEQTPNAATVLKEEYGYSQLPVVRIVTDDENPKFPLHWSGFKPDNIRMLKD